MLVSWSFFAALSTTASALCGSCLSPAGPDNTSPNVISMSATPAVTILNSDRSMLAILRTRTTAKDIVEAGLLDRPPLPLSMMLLP